MRRPTATRTASFALKGAAAASAVAVLSACGGATSGDVAGSDETVRIAVNGWVGYEASAAVLSYLLEEEMGVKVEQQKIDEQPAWQGLNDDDLDVVLENWGHEDLMEQYGPEGNGTVVDGGPNGNTGTLGWYVPEYMVDENPELDTWEGIKENTDLFQTPESGDKGEFLAADPAFVTQDQGMINHFDMDLEIVHAGSEAAQITEMQERYEDEKPFLSYFYDPQWLHNELDLVKVDFPDYEEGCAEDEDDVSCDYQQYDLNKIFRKGFAEEDSAAYRLLDNWTWTNEDQNAVAKMIADEGMDPDEAAEKWATENGDVWEDWIPADA